MADPDGSGGLGVSHWVIYNIPAAVTRLIPADIAANKYTFPRCRIHSIVTAC
jgi:phosphatidylethanolamine-binding protein (PEBP) family uncharacterized protein